MNYRAAARIAGRKTFSGHPNRYQIGTGRGPVRLAWEPWFVPTVSNRDITCHHGRSSAPNLRGKGCRAKRDLRSIATSRRVRLLLSWDEVDGRRVPDACAYRCSNQPPEQSAGTRSDSNQHSR